MGGNKPSKEEPNVYRSSIPDVELPDKPLLEYLFACQPFIEAAKHKKVAIKCAHTGRELLYCDIEPQTKQFAAALAAHGFKAGDTLCIFAPNVPEYAVVYFAVVYLGGRVTTANPTYNAKELAHQLSDSGASRIFTLPPFLEAVLGAQKEVAPQVQEVLVLGDAPEGTTSYSTFMQEGATAPAVEPAKVHTGEVIALPYSSGTTGLSKGVMLTHRNIVSNCVQTSTVMHFQENEVVTAVLPFFHIYGMVVLLLLALAEGAKLLSYMKFDPELFLKTTFAEKSTLFFVAPPLVQFMAKHPAAKPELLASLTHIVSGAAPLSEELAGALVERLPNVKFMRQGYGLTEASPVICLAPPGRTKLGAAGRMLPNQSVKIVDPQGRCVGPGERGELWVKGPNVMAGYLNNPEATRQVLDQKGFLHTGDVAYVDAEGDFFVVDRVKELIKVKGFQVPPAELEGVLQGHPQVADAAVVGAPPEKLGGREGDGELPLAFVVLKQGQQVTAQELMDYVSEHVSEYKRIRGVRFVDSIIKSASGKILRRKMKELI